METLFVDVSEIFIKFIDKYGKTISLAISNIRQITEVENEN